MWLEELFEQKLDSAHGETESVCSTSCCPLLTDTNPREHTAINTGKSITSAWIKIKYQKDLGRKLLEVCWEFLNSLWSSFVNKSLLLMDADLILEIRIIEHLRRFWRSSALTVTVVINFLLKAVKTNFSKWALWTKLQHRTDRSRTTLAGGLSQSGLLLI